jgi:hypothetical protein
VDQALHTAARLDPKRSRKDASSAAAVDLVRRRRTNDSADDNDDDGGGEEGGGGGGGGGGAGASNDDDDDDDSAPYNRISDGHEDPYAEVPVSRRATRAPLDAVLTAVHDDLGWSEQALGFLELCLVARGGFKALAMVEELRGCVYLQAQRAIVDSLLCCTMLHHIPAAPLCWICTMSWRLP